MFYRDAHILQLCNLNLLQLCNFNRKDVFWRNKARNLSATRGFTMNISYISCFILTSCISYIVLGQLSLSLEDQVWSVVRQIVSCPPLPLYDDFVAHPILTMQDVFVSSYYFFHSRLRVPIMVFSLNNYELRFVDDAVATWERKMFSNVYPSQILLS